MVRTAEGVLVVLQQQIDGQLQRLARRHGLRPLVTTMPHHAVRDIIEARATLVVVDVGLPPDRALAFIRSLAALGSTDGLVAAARHHTRALEAAVLRAGARFYIPNLRSPAADTVLAAVARAQRTGAIGENVEE